MIRLETTVTPAMEEVDIYRSFGTFLVQRYQILTTNRVCYDVWEPGAYHETHTTLRTIEGRVYGDVTTRTLPDELELLPAWTTLRIEAIHAYQKALVAMAESYVKLLYGEDFTQ
jgi:hypothetical protein